MFVCSDYCNENFVRRPAFFFKASAVSLMFWRYMEIRTKKNLNYISFFSFCVSDIFMSAWFSDIIWALVFQMLFEPFLFRYFLSRCVSDCSELLCFRYFFRCCVSDIFWAVVFQILFEPFLFRYFLSRCVSDCFELLCFRYFFVCCVSDIFWAVVFQILFEPFLFSYFLSRCVSDCFELLCFR